MDNSLFPFLRSNTQLKTLKLNHIDDLDKICDIRLFLFKEPSASALVVLHLCFPFVDLSFHGIKGPLFSLRDLKVTYTAYDVCWFAGTVCPNLVSFNLDTAQSESAEHGTADTDFQSASIEHLTILSCQSFTLHNLPNLKTLHVHCDSSTKYGDVHMWKISHKLESVSTFPAKMSHPVQMKKLSFIATNSEKPCSYDVLIHTKQDLEELNLTLYNYDPEDVLQFQYPVLKKLRVCVAPDQISNFQKNITKHTPFPMLEHISVHIFTFDDSDDDEEEKEEEENPANVDEYLHFFLACLGLFQNIKSIRLEGFLSAETYLHLKTSLEQFIYTKDRYHDGVVVESILVVKQSVMYKKEKA